MDLYTIDAYILLHGPLVKRMSKRINSAKAETVKTPRLGTSV
jgi:hypothetical protein